ncbi:MAG TPA: hypothetical protein VJ725_26505 [Thermoanaerobaculia bacterium]|nr:hypothetical protein [Thermoanaerobaculia bacterium]
MLSWACRRFRAAFAPGSRHPHRERCAECRGYAEALERAAGLRLPVPGALGQRLAAIAAPREEAPVLRFPRPQVPLPAGLHERLRGIARRERQGLPAWIRSPRYAVAASYVLAVLLTALFGDLGGSFVRKVEEVVEVTETRGLEKIEALRGTAQERYEKARRSVASVGSGITGTARGLNPFHEDEPPAPESEAPGLERRTP